MTGPLDKGSCQRTNPYGRACTGAAMSLPVKCEGSDVAKATDYVILGTLYIQRGAGAMRLERREELYGIFDESGNPLLRNSKRVG